MTTSSTKRKTSKNNGTTETQRARKTAFQKLFARAEAESQAAKAKQRAEKYAGWRGAAGRFKGLSEELTARIELRNIHFGTHGYKVSFMRDGESFSRHFAGLSEESLAAAINFRDEAAKIVGEPKTLAIPARVLKSLGLAKAVVRIAREAASSSYSVSYKNEAGKNRSRKFSFLYVPEEDAYAAAIGFLEETLK